MRTIFQIDRRLLGRQAKSAKQYVRGRVLDVGSGDFLRYRDFFSFDVYDTLEPDAAKKPTIVGSAEQMPLQDALYDTVISTQVLEHLPHPSRAVSEMFRILKPGGYAVVTVPQWNELHEEPYDYWRYTSYGLQALFSEAGFRIERLEARGGFFAFFGQVVTRFIIDAFHLYEHPLWNLLWFAPLKAWGLCMFWLDNHIRSKAARKHTLGWLCVAQKPP